MFLEGHWKARNVLLEGRRWRIGDGFTMQIWDESWVPSFKTLPIPRHLAMVGVKNLTVSMLMEANLNHYDEVRVGSTFDPLVVAKNLEIRLSPNQRPNKWVWAEDKQGLFSIKITYHTIQNIEESFQGDCSNPSPLKQVWKRLW